MRAATREAVVPFSTHFEGLVLHPYLDRKKLASGGLGFLLEPVEVMLSLRWVHRGTGRPADRSEVIAAYRTIHAHPELADGGGVGYRKLTDLDMTMESLWTMYGQKLAPIDRAMTALFPDGYQSWCCDAQLGTISMEWGLGSDGIRQKFPKLTAALRAGHWAEVVAQCRMDETLQTDSFRRRNLANATLFRNAGIVAQRGLDPSVLYYPQVLTADAMPESTLAGATLPLLIPGANAPTEPDLG